MACSYKRMVHTMELLVVLVIGCCALLVVLVIGLVGILGVLGVTQRILELAVGSDMDERQGGQNKPNGVRTRDRKAEGQPAGDRWGKWGIQCQHRHFRKKNYFSDEMQEG